MISRLTPSLLIIAILGATLLTGLGCPPTAQADGERLVLAFYYTWFDRNTWNSGKVPDLPQHPYNSDDRAVMARQIDEAKGAGIDAFVLNWWGRGNRTEKNLKALLDIATQKGFRVAVDFDINSPFMGGVDSYAANLRHLHAVHASHPAYLRYLDRPVVLFYNVSNAGVSTLMQVFKSLAIPKPIFAVVTETSITWTLTQLMDHLIEEKRFHEGSG